MPHIMSDPAVHLGPSIFLHILSFVPFDTILSVEQVCKPWRDLVRTYEKSIWQKVALDLDEGNPDLHLLELANTSSNQDGQDDVVPSSQGWSDARGDKTGKEWRKACEDAIVLDRNWRFGRCREHWITTPGNNVWRFKIDAKQGTCLATSRHVAGVHVVDAETSEHIFSITGVRRQAHMEFVTGHAIFDVGRVDFSLEVWRTSDAISASKHPTPTTRSPLSRTSKSFTHSSWAPGSDEPLPRGHLEYYKTITPPTTCHAFRARLDHAGTKDQRALLATAGVEAVHIWDMEEADPLKRETIVIDPEDHSDISYVEFDEDYVFLCNPFTVQILSRKTKRKVYEFPDADNWCRALNWISFPAIDGAELECQAPPPYYTSAKNGIARKPLRQCIDVGSNATYDDEEVFTENVLQSMANLFEDLDISRDTFPDCEFEWNACHFTRDDLHVTSVAGTICTIRNYRSLLAIEDPMRRGEELVKHTIWNNVEHGAHLLATTPTRVVAAAVDQIVFWNPGDMPPLHLDDDLPSAESREKGRCQLAQICAFAALDEASCLQVDHKRIYVTYLAAGDQRYETDPVPSDYPKIGDGRAIKCWDFSN